MVKEKSINVRKVMQSIAIVLVVIGVLGLIVLLSMRLVVLVGENECKPYELAGYETEVNPSDGCMVFFKGEFARVNKIEEYFEIQDLKQKLEKIPSFENKVFVCNILNDSTGYCGSGATNPDAIEIYGDCEYKFIFYGKELGVKK